MKKRISVFLALLLMNLSVMLALAGAAKREWQLFDMISDMTGPDAVKNADLVMQRNLYTGTVNGMEFTVTEAGYAQQIRFASFLDQAAGNDRGNEVDEFAADQGEVSLDIGFIETFIILVPIEDQLQLPPVIISWGT